MLSKIWFVLLAIAVVALVWMGIPYLGSAYYLNRGARGTDYGE